MTKYKVTYTNGKKWILKFDKYEHPLYISQVIKSYKACEKVSSVELIQNTK